MRTALKHNQMNKETLDIIASGNYSIAEIKRKSDGKVFVCYYRYGSVKVKSKVLNLNAKHWFIEKNESIDKEELCLYDIDLEVYDIIDVIED